MDTRLIKEKFNRIGARVRFSELDDRRISRTPNAVVIDVTNSRKGGIYDIRTKGNIELSVPDIRKADRHLLIMAKIYNDGLAFTPEIIKTLCGHDEREYFAAQVPNKHVCNVLTAMQALKPGLAVESQKNHRVKLKDLNRRKNPGFIRQGEWFFVPADELNVNEEMVLSPKGGEPLVLAGQRGGNKPHRAQYAYIVGGTRVYVTRAPWSAKISDNDRGRLVRGLTEKEKAKFIRENPEAKSWSWSVMTRNPELYVRGWIRHPDHKTIILKEWYRVAVNAEIRGKNVVFLD